MPIIPATIRSLIEKQLMQIKSIDPHAVLATLMSNNTTKNRREETDQDDQRLRLDIWDMPGSTLSSGITHQVRLSSGNLKPFSHVFCFIKDLSIITSDLFISIRSNERFASTIRLE